MSYVWHNANAPGCYSHCHTDCGANMQYVGIGQFLSSFTLEWYLYHEIRDSYSAPLSWSYEHLNGKRDANARLSISLSNSPTCFDTIEHGTTSHHCMNQYSIFNIAAYTEFLAKRSIYAYLRLEVRGFCMIPSRSRCASKATWSVFFRTVEFVTKSPTRGCV